MSIFVLAGVLGLVSSAPGQPLSEDFESGLPATWTGFGLWHVTDQCPRPSDCGPSQWAYYGEDASCTFDVGSTGGALTSPLVNLPFGAELTYCSAYEGEGGNPYDSATVEIDDDSVIDGPLTTDLDWQIRAADLTPFAGKTVRLVWSFDSVDGVSNSQLGWQVDSVIVETPSDVLLLDEDFPGFPTLWDFFGLWHVTSSCVETPNCLSPWAYFGDSNDCDFDLGVRVFGDLTSPLVTIPPEGALLSYCSRYGGEGGNPWDRAVVKVLTVVDGPLPEVFGNPDWEVRTVPLGVVGPARVLFRFDTVDAVINDRLGWQIDNIEIQSGVEPAMLATSWSDQRVHGLDSELQDLGGFPVPTAMPNGVTTDGTTIWIARPDSASVSLFDLSGGPVGSWSKLTGACQGITYVQSTDEIAVLESGIANFYEPLTGVFLRSLAVSTSTAEGLAADGDSFWVLADDIEQRDLFTGALLASIPNPAANDPFGGTGIANRDAMSLVVATLSGNWYRVSKATGFVLEMGNNGLDMYGLGAIPGVGVPIVRGDCNGDLQFNGLSDTVFALGFQFTPGAPEPPCLAHCDANGDGDFNGLIDGVFMLNFQFVPGSPPIPEPFGGCGVEPADIDSVGQLGCATPVCP